MTAPEGFRQAPSRVRLGVGAVCVLVLVALAATVAIGIWRGASAPVEQVAPAAIDETDAPDDAVIDGDGSPYVHVDGAVDAPGLYVLEPSARLVDAIAAAGGFADDAERSAVNLARPVTDGEQIVVPRQGEAPPAGAEEQQGAGGAVDLNTADAAQLEELPGIGPALAQRIIDWREAEGGFRAVDDLLAVSGIGPKVLEGLREQVTV